MYSKIKDYFKEKVRNFVVGIATETAELKATEIATYKAYEVAQKEAFEISTKISEKKSLEILTHIENDLLVDVDKKLSYSTHIILELLKQIHMLKASSMNIENDIWEKYRNRYIGIWLGGNQQIVKGKEPIANFFGAGINCVLSEFPLTIIEEEDTLDNVEVIAFWGQSSHIKYLPLLYLITLKQKEVLFIEDGFIYNIFSHTKSLTGEYPKELTVGMSYTIDDITSHFDGSMPSRLEQIIASDFEIENLEIVRSKLLIKSIVKNKITKYNYQSLEIKKYGNNKQKVLVIDQAYGDYSVYKSGATEQVFSQMLSDAIAENPDADILVKVHPDMIANPNRAGAKHGGYFGNMKLDNPNIIIIKEEINPYIILEQVQKVYVCTSQLGFEALMLQKKVIVYGVPFYAGWGVTLDRGNEEFLQRRNKKRTIEELFWFAYIWYSRYYNPITRKVCKIEDILNYITNEYIMLKVKNEK